MTLAELISRYRTLANDRAEPFFVSNDEVRDFLNEAETQACIRGRLIHAADDAEVCDLAALAGFIWSLVVTYQIWRKRRG